jgi:predicted amidohydrolase
VFTPFRKVTPLILGGIVLALGATHSVQAQGSPAARNPRAIILQPKWGAADFATPAQFETWMRNQLEQAQTKMVTGRPNLVVLTELNGVGLLLQASPAGRLSNRFDWAVAINLFKRFPEVAFQAIRHQVSLQRGLLLTLAPEVLEQYVPLCSKLAKEFKVYLVCGSAPLPHLERVEGGAGGSSGIGAVRILGSEVYNQSLIFGPDGKLLGSADKVHLTELEGQTGLDFSSGSLAELRAYPTPVGTLGIAISLDAFKSDVIQKLEGQGADILVQPDANGQSWVERESGTRSNRDQPLAWLDSAWNMVQQSKTLKYALNPMVVGNFLDAPFDGQSAIIGKAKTSDPQQSYVLTPPRGGFLALMPWVATGTPDELRNVGKKLGIGSKHSYQNAYATGILSADLELAPPSSALPALRPHEHALDALANGATLERPWFYWRYSFVFLWGVMWLVGVILSKRKKKRGLPLVWLGLLGMILSSI